MLLLTVNRSNRLFGIMKVWRNGEKAARGAQSSEALHVEVQTMIQFFRRQTRMLYRLSMMKKPKNS